MSTAPGHDRPCLEHALAALQPSARARKACAQLGVATVAQFLLAPRQSFLALPGCGERTYDELQRKVCQWLARSLGDPDCERDDRRPLLPLVQSQQVEHALHELGIRTVGEFLAVPRERLLAVPSIGWRAWQRVYAAIARTRPVAPASTPLLPETMRSLPLRQAALPAPVLQQLEDLGCTTIGHAMTLPASVFAAGGELGPVAAAAVRASLDELFRVALEQVDSALGDGLDWPTLRGRLLAPLDDGDRDFFCQRIGLGAHARPGRDPGTMPRPALEATAARDEAVRARLHERAPSLMCRLRHEAVRELAAFEGVIRGDRLAVGTLLHTARKGSGDRELPLRLLAFCFPAEFHGLGNCLTALPARTSLQFQRELCALTAPPLLPRPLKELVQHLRAVVDPVPRGLLLHLLADACRLRVHYDPERGEMVLPHQPALSVRLADLLQEEGQPTRLEDLVFHYRERFRKARRQRLQTHLRQDPTFLEIGPDVWSLRTWHEDELAIAARRAEEVVRIVNERGGKQHVPGLLAGADQRTVCLVLDLVRRDARLRYLGRSEVCPAGHARSQVLEQLLIDFRRAAGEVVYSRFLDNQPPERRRLVQRLLAENRLFVFPSPDRIDVLTNYPFNDERLQRFLALVDTFLRDRNGYAPLTAVLDEVNRCDLGGGWLHPTLLGELLRRHGPFEVLPGGFVARGTLGLGNWLLRRARNALREAAVPISLQEILVERPELTEFAGCLEGLLRQDPLVQTPDGARFQIA